MDRLIDINIERDYLSEHGIISHDFSTRYLGWVVSCTILEENCGFYLYLISKDEEELFLHIYTVREGCNIIYNHLLKWFGTEDDFRNVLNNSKSISNHTYSVNSKQIEMLNDLMKFVMNRDDNFSEKYSLR